MDSSQMLFIHLKVLEILLQQLGQPSSQMQPCCLRYKCLGTHFSHPHTFWEGSKSWYMSDLHFREHRWRWDRRTHTLVQCAAGASCAPQPWLTVNVQVTDFVFSVGNEIQSHTNNYICFPFSFQSGLASYWKSQILIKFAFPLLFSAKCYIFFLLDK